MHPGDPPCKKIKVDPEDHISVFAEGETAEKIIKRMGEPVFDDDDEGIWEPKPFSSIMNENVKSKRKNFLSLDHKNTKERCFGCLLTHNGEDKLYPELSNMINYLIHNGITTTSQDVTVDLIHRTFLDYKRRSIGKLSSTGKDMQIYSNWSKIQIYEHLGHITVGSIIIQNQVKELTIVKNKLLELCFEKNSKTGITRENKNSLDSYLKTVALLNKTVLSKIKGTVFHNDIIHPSAQLES